MAPGVNGERAEPAGTHENARKRRIQGVAVKTATVTALIVLSVPLRTGSLASPAQPASLETVLRRAEQYVVDYEPQISRVVAREEYVQKLVVERRPGHESRRLVSDFLFLRLPGRRGSWLGIREVLEVDGLPVSGSGRIDAAAGASPADIEGLAHALAFENAKYNIGGFQRTVNVPFVVLSWLHPGFRDQFKFRSAGVERMDGIDASRVEFEERDRPTIIRTPDGEDVVSRGTIWLDPDTGRVLRTELRNRPKPIGATIGVRFAWHEALGIMVPVSMHERYTERRGTLECEATYSNFRRFDVVSTIR